MHLTTAQAVPCRLPGRRGRSPLIRASHGQFSACSRSVIWPAPWPQLRPWPREARRRPPRHLAQRSRPGCRQSRRRVDLTGDCFRICSSRRLRQSCERLLTSLENSMRGKVQHRSRNYSLTPRPLAVLARRAQTYAFYLPPPLRSKARGGWMQIRDRVSQALGRVRRAPGNRPTVVHIDSCPDGRTRHRAWRASV